MEIFMKNIDFLRFLSILDRGRYVGLGRGGCFGWTSILCG